MNLQNRKSKLLIEYIDELRLAFRHAKYHHPFTIDAIVILPDHLHMMMTLPANDGNFSLRWNLIKGIFSRQLPTQESISPIQKNRRERGIWQKRFWEHLIRDELDFEYHVNYIHYNPVKHGHVDHPVDCGLIQASIDLFEMGFFLLIGRVKYSLYLYLGNNEMSGEAPDLRLLCILSDG